MKRINVRDLENRHRSLDQEIRRLERRGMHMTPPEQERAHLLKVARLATKDAIIDLQRVR